MNKDIKNLQIGQPIITCFSRLEDPRIVGRTKHKLIDVIVIAICAIICGAKHWNQIAAFGELRKEWLQTFLELPNDIPSKYTFGRVFSLIEPISFQECFIAWSKEVSRLTSGEIIAIDGKTLRKSFHKEAGKEALHIVNAFAVNNGITLGSIKVPDKSNEIKGIPKLLQMLKLTGCIVTIDAMGTQKGIAKLIRMKGADYVLALKKNQGRLYKKVSSLFAKAEQLHYQNMVYKVHTTKDYDHSRIEEREYRILPIMYLHAFTKQWKDIKSVIGVKSKVEATKNKTAETRYYITSLTLKDYKNIAKSIRRHWTVENKLHWKLDVAMAEDACRIYKERAAENFSALRKLALFYLEKDRSIRGGIAFKHFIAAQDPQFLPRILNLQ
jgi:predicted transposase YbfD/YdcC